VTGEAPGGRLVLLAGARPGDALILTRPLGTGVVLAADMQGGAPGAWVQDAHARMLEGNAAAAQWLRRRWAHAATDVSGFGLAGHLGELCRASAVSARVWLSRLPALPGALVLLDRGVRSTFHAQNAQSRDALAVAREAAGSPALELLFDPQTSGGLLLAVEPETAEGWIATLREAGCAEASLIGRFEAPRDDGVVIEVEP
jgi:selenide, water dikinase